MDIAEQKQEILNLLEKLHHKSVQKKSLEAGDKGLKIQRPSTRDPIRRRRQELLDLRSRKERLGQDLLEERLLSICQMLEERISRIESIIEHGAHQSGMTQEKGPPHGIDLATDLQVLTPDPNMTSPAPVEGAGPQETNSASHQVQHAQEDPAPDLSGQIQNGIIPDIIQLISSNKKTGILTLENKERKIDLYLHNGEMYHAATEGMAGHTAFFAAIALEDGSFNFKETYELHDENTIGEDTQFLILEALRQIDEDKSGA